MTDLDTLILPNLTRTQTGPPNSATLENSPPTPKAQPFPIKIETTNHGCTPLGIDRSICDFVPVKNTPTFPPCPNAPQKRPTNQQGLLERQAHDRRKQQTAKDSPACTHPKWRSGSMPTPRARTHCVSTSPPAFTRSSNEDTSVGWNGPGGCSGSWPAEAKSSMATMTVHEGFGFAPEPPVFFPPGEGRVPVSGGLLTYDVRSTLARLQPAAKIACLLTDCVPSRCLCPPQRRRGFCFRREELEFFLAVSLIFFCE